MGMDWLHELPSLNITHTGRAEASTADSCTGTLTSNKVSWYGKQLQQPAADRLKDRLGQAEQITRRKHNNLSAKEHTGCQCNMAAG
jgi:hypothetical protein